MTHLKLANSPLMAVLCGLTILIVLLQPVIFMAAAFKRGKELNMTKEEMKEAARSSAIFSIIPSLPIIVSYLLLGTGPWAVFPLASLKRRRLRCLRDYGGQYGGRGFRPGIHHRRRDPGGRICIHPLCGHHRYPWRKHLQRILLKEL